MILDWAVADIFVIAALIAVGGDQVSEDAEVLAVVETGGLAAVTMTSAILGRRWIKACRRQHEAHDAWLEELARQRDEQSAATPSVGAPGSIAPVPR